MDRSPPGSSVHGILQARVLEWAPCSPPRDLPAPGIKPESLRSPALASRFFTASATWEAQDKGLNAINAKKMNILDTKEHQNDGGQEEK